VSKESNRKSLMGIGGLAVVAAVVCICAHYEPRFPGDSRLTVLFQSVHSSALESVMKWASSLSGGWGWEAVLLLVASAIVVWRCLGRLEAGLVLMTGLSPIVYSAIKLVVNRPRPSPDLVRVLEADQGRSFPSGHAFFAAVFLGLLAYFAFVHLRKLCLRVLALLGFLMLTLLIGASRIYLGAHWASDVLGGYLLGAVFLATLIWLYLRFRSHPSGAL